MAEDLAARLVEKAAEAIGGHVRPREWAEDVAQLAVVAVLETLAAEGFILYSGRRDVVTLHALAERVKETRNG